MSAQRQPRWITGLFVLFVVETAVLAIAPHDRQTWVLENLLVLAGVPLLLLSWFRFPLSSPSYALILLFLMAHEVGAHYTYSSVPYDAWVRALSGTSLDAALGWERNHYDRAVHFLYGLLLVYPIRELVVADRGSLRVWSYLQPVLLTIAASAIYELLEWAAAVVFAPEVGIAFVGAQGDVWDAHRDMALAAGGAVLTMAATYGRGRMRR